WDVYQSNADAQLGDAAGLPLTIVPLDSTTYVRLSDEERKRVASHGSALSYALERLYRLWLISPTDRRTLHDQRAVAEAVQRGRSFERQETLTMSVEDQGYTRIDRNRGKAVTVCLEPKRDDFMKYYLDELTSH